MSDWVGEDWFRRAVPALVLVQVLALASWMMATEYSDTSTAPRGTTHASIDDAGARAALPRPKVGNRYAIRDGAGTIGGLKLGMRIEEAEEVLEEKFIVIQQQDLGGRRFELLAPKSGLKLMGVRSRIDTVTITNTGNGRRYVTALGVRVGDSEQSIPRKYAYSYLVCGREWWVQRGANTVRFTVNKGVASITLTSIKQPLHVQPCS